MVFLGYSAISKQSGIKTGIFKKTIFNLKSSGQEEKLQKIGVIYYVGLSVCLSLRHFLSSLLGVTQQ